MVSQFTRIQEPPAAAVVEMVEQLLREWNIDPASVKDPDKNLWYLMQGSARFHIELFKFNKGPVKGAVDCLEIGGTIMKLPQENFLPLYRRLLDLNATAVGLYFAIRKNLVMLLATHEAIGLDYEKFKLLVDEVRYFSDHWDDVLMQEFGGSK